MLSIEKALSQFTDQILESEDTSTDKIISHLDKKDVGEFLESAEMIRLIYASKQTQKFDTFFAELDRHRKEIYELPQAVDFRGKVDKDVTSQIDKLFDEEFKDD